MKLLAPRKQSVSQAWERCAKWRLPLSVCNRFRSPSLPSASIISLQVVLTTFTVSSSALLAPSRSADFCCFSTVIPRCFSLRLSLFPGFDRPCPAAPFNAVRASAMKRKTPPP